eukprot:SAG22_NODE_1048_length_5851_cov_33.333449_2_plen_237_part_00
MAAITHQTPGCDVKLRMMAEAREWLADLGRAGRPFEASYECLGPPTGPAGGAWGASYSTSASLYQYNGDGDAFGIRFRRPIQPTDSADELQALLDYVTVERVSLPGLGADAGWRVAGEFPVPSFSSETKRAGGQRVTVDSFSGGILRWSVRDCRLSAIGGTYLPALREARLSPPDVATADIPMSQGSYFEVKAQFTGHLKFAIQVAGVCEALAAAEAARRPRGEAIRQRQEREAGS